MLRKDFLTYSEFSHAIGADDEAIRQGMLRGELRAYVELKDVRARYETDGGIAPESGSGINCSWRHRGRPKDRGGGCDWLMTLCDEYTLAGWFALTADSLKRVARHSAFETFPRVLPPPQCAETALDGDSFHLAHASWTKEDGENGYYDLETDFLANCPMPKNPFALLWFLAADADSLKEPIVSKPIPVSEKSLTERERNNLLRIIAALAKDAGIPLGDRKGGAKNIADAVARFPFDSPKEDTIRKVLTQVRKLHDEP